MSFVQKIFKLLLSKQMFESVKEETKSWSVRCVKCGQEQSLWDLGGIRWKAVGNSRTLKRCENCNALTWHQLSNKNQTTFDKKISLQILSKIFLMVGTVFLIVALAVGLSKYIKIKEMKREPGEITSIVPNKYGKGFRYEIEYSFSDKTYQLVTLINRNPQMYKVKDKVTVFVNQSNPHEAILNDFLELWFFAGLIGVLAFSFLITSLILFGFSFRYRS